MGDFLATEDGHQFPALNGAPRTFEIFRRTEELRSFSPDRLERAADYIHRLRPLIGSGADKRLRSSAGILAGVRGQEFARNIEECEKADARD